MLAKSELNKIDFLISKALNDSDIRHDEFFSVNNVLREYKDMTEKIKIIDKYVWNNKRC